MESLAVQRLLDLPELLTCIYIELDDPIAFSSTSKKLRLITKDTTNVYKWFSRRYFRCEILFELLRRPYLCSIDMIDVGNPSRHLKLPSRGTNEIDDL